MNSGSCTNGIFQWLSISETSTAPLCSSWLAVGNSCEEVNSSIPETFCHSDQTTMQQHSLDDEVTLCSENGKKSRLQRISECFT